MTHQRAFTHELLQFTQYFFQLRGTRKLLNTNMGEELDKFRHSAPGTHETIKHFCNDPTLKPDGSYFDDLVFLL
ncbi:hypothetical protein DSECCO2_418000 [anaerobic digester metagenome]